MDKGEDAPADGAGAGRKGRRSRAPAKVPMTRTKTPRGNQKLRLRRDGFTPLAQAKFLKTLRKTGCVRDGCRVAGVSSTTAYRTRARLAAFDKAWETALTIAASDIELLAWDRAVEGVEVTTLRKGEVVAVTKKPSDAIFRMLLIASNRKKYGNGMRAGGETPRQIEKRVRKQVEAKLRSERRVPMQDDELRQLIFNKLQEKNAELRLLGWRETSTGRMIAPGVDPVAGETIVEGRARPANPYDEAAAKAKAKRERGAL